MSGSASRPEPLGGGNRARRGVILAGMATVVVFVAVVTGSRLASGSEPRRAASSTPTSTATVQRASLTETTPVNGTVGFASLVPGGPSPLSIVQPIGISPSALGADQLAVTAAQQALAADRQAAADAATANALSLSQAQQALLSAHATLRADAAALNVDQSTLMADQQHQASDCQGSDTTGNGSSASVAAPASGGQGPSSPCSADQAQVASDQKAVTADQQNVATNQAAVSAAQGQVSAARQKAVQSSHQDQAKVSADQIDVAKAVLAAGGAQTARAAYEPTSKYTALPAVGQVIKPGQALWSIDGRPVALIPGALTSWRAFATGMAPGPDVAALDQALIALGDGAGLSVSNDFTPATASAIDRLEAALEVPQTGALALGTVIFEPTALRVTGVHPPIGAPVTAGAPVLDVTSTTPAVNVALPVAQSYLVKVSDPVSVTLPDNTTAPGTITAVGTVATNTTPGSGSAGSPSAPSSSPPAATITVTVSLAQVPRAALADQAPVTVNITNGIAHDTLAVPTTALLALAGGGYAVEFVEPDGSHRLVPVTTGIFDDQSGMVQVSGAGLAPGQKVVAAA